MFKISYPKTGRWQHYDGENLLILIEPILNFSHSNHRSRYVVHTGPIAYARNLIAH